jgi:YD repeat-containing protein
MPTVTPIPTGPVTITYDYDPLKRLTDASYSDGTYYTYTYDAVGNRKTQESYIAGLLTNDTYTYDIANRLTNVNGIENIWDENGNTSTPARSALPGRASSAQCLFDDGLNAYAYDVNRLTGISTQSSLNLCKVVGISEFSFNPPATISPGLRSIP